MMLSVTASLETEGGRRKRALYQRASATVVVGVWMSICTEKDKEENDRHDHHMAITVMVTDELQCQTPTLHHILVVEEATCLSACSMRK